MRVHQKITGTECGLQDFVMVHAWLMGRIGQGCWWVCRHVSMTLLHMHKAFPTLRGEANNHDIIRWHHYCSAYINVERVFKEAHTRPGEFLVQFICSVGSWSFGLFPGWFIWEATDPLTALPHCLLRSGITALQGSVLYLFNHTYSRLCWVPWVSVPQLFVS